MASVSGPDSRPATVTLIWSGVMQLHDLGCPPRPGLATLARISLRFIRPSAALRGEFGLLLQVPNLGDLICEIAGQLARVYLLLDRGRQIRRARARAIVLWATWSVSASWTWVRPPCSMRVL